MTPDRQRDTAGDVRAAHESLEKLREAAKEGKLGSLDSHRSLRGLRFSKAARETYGYLAAKAVDPHQAVRPGVAELNHFELNQHLRKRLKGAAPKKEWLEQILASLEDCCLIERPPEAEREKGKRARGGYEVRVLAIGEVVLGRAKRHLRWLLDLLPEEEAMSVVESWLVPFKLRIVRDAVDMP